MDSRAFYIRSARGSADCIHCPRAPKAKWCDACRRAQFYLDRWKKRLGLVIVIDLPQRRIRYERQEAMNTSETKRNVEAKYPETLEFPETGASFILMAKEVRAGIETKYGERTVVECIERATKNRFSVWWPKGLPPAPTNFPFILARLSKRDWKLVTCDTREEALELWKEGEIKNPVKPADTGSDFS